MTATVLKFKVKLRKVRTFLMMPNPSVAGDPARLTVVNITAKTVSDTAQSEIR